MNSPLLEYSFPRYFIVETVRRCNSRCPFCTMGRGTAGKQGTMTKALFDKLLSEIRPHATDVKQISLYGNGEPMLDKDIVERIRQVHEMGIKVFLTSNMSLLDEKMAESVLMAGTDILRMSISSVVREKYEQLRPGLDFDAVMHNAEAYFAIRDRLRPDSHIHVSMEEHDILTSEDIAAWEKHWAPLVKPGDFLKSSPIFPFPNYEGTSDFDKEYVKPCEAMMQTMYITYNGDVTLCTRDLAVDTTPFLAGNLEKSSIADVWMSPTLRRVRDLHREGMRNEIPICQGCIAWDGERKSAKEAGGK